MMVQLVLVLVLVETIILSYHSSSQTHKMKRILYNMHLLVVYAWMPDPTMADYLSVGMYEWVITMTRFFF
jgi:hypothetical protein